MSTLKPILEAKRREIEALYASRPKTPHTRATGPAPSAQLRRPPGAPLRLITEIKRRSPSAGSLSTVLSPAERALAYAEHAAMISVLCDRTFFDGAFEHLAEARRALDDAGAKTPLLAKEFILDPVQLDVAREHGASAALLIARIVSVDELARLAEHACGIGLEPLVEVVNHEELDAALAAKATMIGVNARNLDTLEIDVRNAANILAAIPPDVVAIHLSGIRSGGDVRALAASKIDAVLVGECLMRQDDPRSLLQELSVASRT